MTSRDFVYWIQGFMEIAKPEAMTAEQTEMVKRHLAMVFIHEIDPSMPDPKLDAAHKPPTLQTVADGSEWNAPPKPVAVDVVGGEGPMGMLYRC